jgi:hypothetical protein
VAAPGRIRVRLDFGSEKHEKVCRNAEEAFDRLKLWLRKNVGLHTHEVTVTDLRGTTQPTQDCRPSAPALSTALRLGAGVLALPSIIRAPAANRSRFTFHESAGRPWPQAV